ncbi:DivIVA domain-containing protein [Streptomyces antimicrobicus]|uniref:DivIVA domain-containing protein n=1 Tax=Streptomyces antimicrobicus TaxID=2883108 RepID=A0ABS8B888_9ACTN|nr:DivIVA domain-containing protein [Streptomyces antimicrobicus]MCB5180835.1 DivIVA domain-containing protein [Streptomyces antimicrobicus]
MFWFLLIALVVVVAAVTLAVIGGGEEAVLPEAAPERVADGLPESRPVLREDIDALRLPVAPRGYRMAEVDDVLLRLGAELAERDKRIAELEAALAGGAPTARGGAAAGLGGAPAGQGGAPAGQGGPGPVKGEQL